jgi:hypothetical protein
VWDCDSVYFRDEQGAYYKNDWHHVEAYFKLNNIVAGKGIPDGKIRYWYDEKLLISYDDILFRTAQFPDMKLNQFLIAPYIGDGSPIEQTMWIDELTVATAPIESDVADVSNKNKMNISPNPASDYITISGLFGYVKIYDIIGCEVWSGEVKEGTKIDISNFCDGIYFIRFKNYVKHFLVIK